MTDNTFSIDALLEMIVAHNASDLHTTGRFAAYASRARRVRVRVPFEPAASPAAVSTVAALSAQ